MAIKITKDGYFGWADSIYRAKTDCEVAIGGYEGDAIDVLAFDLDATEEEVQKVGAALGADMSCFDLLGDDFDYLDDGPVTDDEASQMKRTPILTKATGPSAHDRRPHLRRIRPASSAV